jgi:hypothetical protein
VNGASANPKRFGDLQDACTVAQFTLDLALNLAVYLWSAK